MKKAPFIVALAITFILELVAALYFVGKMTEIKRDPVLVNECLKSIENNYGNETAYADVLDYVILNNDGDVEYATEGFVETAYSINAAIKNNDLILDLDCDGEIVGKIIFPNEAPHVIEGYRKNIVTTLVVIFTVQFILVLLYFFYLKRTIIDPFKKMNAFAARVAEGNLDVPLNLDRGHIFGSFTESFDLMRSELKKARAAEKKANDDKKEMVAKLSHDIKTPIASIKSTSEFGYELTKEERTKEMFNMINAKSDQITTMMDNLFNTTINDITEIEVNPGSNNSSVIRGMLSNADYMNRCKNLSELEIPVCNIFCDKLRLQQTFDNIFMNSYKYADTAITVGAIRDGEYLVVSIVDEGPGVKREELPLLKEKYKRGSNTEGKDGAGLGLYLCNYFLDKMDGKLELRNVSGDANGGSSYGTAQGFCVQLYIRVI